MNLTTHGSGTDDLLQRLVAQPLYAPLTLTGDDDPRYQISKLRLFSGTFDLYCPICKRHTPWSVVVPNELATIVKYEKLSRAAPVNQSSGGSIQMDWLQPFDLPMQCMRQSHIAKFYFSVTGGGDVPVKLTKHGQYPSLRDFQLGDIAELEEAMTSAQRREYVQAITTAANGFSVAACVYYRRVFESLLVSASEEHMAEHSMADWPEFKIAKTDVRINLLSDRLPAFLSEHPEIYGLLSKGVHELTEEQCAAELPILRAAMELILKDRLNALREAKQRAAVSKLIAQSVNRVK